MTFRVGQKVVCVDLTDINCPDGLVEGGIYTVGWVGTGRSLRNGRYDGIRLLEVVRPHRPKDPEPNIAFASRRFRPVVERETDISVFTEILRTTKTPQTVSVCSQQGGAS